MIVSIDDGCPGMRDVGTGIIAATAQQYPAIMAVLGLDAADTYARTGRKVTGNTVTGVNLITEKREPGDKSMAVAWVSRIAGAGELRSVLRWILGLQAEDGPASDTNS